MAIPATFLPNNEPLRRWEKGGIAVLFVLFAAFCALVVDRSAYQDIRLTDANVYFRAAWAVRSGANLYETPDDNGLHYAYPPLLAVLLAPLADAPAGSSRDGMLPYDWSIILWLVLSVAATFVSIHWFAQGLEENAADPALRTPPVGCRRWWSNRLLPFLICVAPIGCTYSRGQVTPLILLCIAGMFRNTVRGRNFRSGVWLAMAICLKVIPALLLIYPLLRRDFRALSGVAFGVFLGAFAIPALALGPVGAFEVTEQFVETVIKPGLNLGGAGTLFREMMSMNRPGCQSIKAIIHNYQFWDPATRPDRPNAITTLGHYFASALLVGGLSLAFIRRRRDDAVGQLTMLGALLTVMIMISPESHTHYFCFPIPLVMALAHRSIEAKPERVNPTPGTFALLIFASLCFTLVMIPFWDLRREAGIPLYGSLVLWVAALIQLRRQPALVAARQPSPLSCAA